MAYSMTGLGVGEVQKTDTTITVELKSINNRFLEVSCRMPPHLFPFERKVKDIIRNYIQRGKIYVTISVQGETDGIMGLRVNAKMALSVRSLLEELCKKVGIDGPLRLEHFLNYSEIFEPAGETKEVEEIWEHVEEALSMALVQLKTMREKEGEVLCKDIMERILVLKHCVDDVERLSRQNLDETYKKISERIQRLINDKEVDVDRLHMEIAILADRMDVTEECVRMRSHNQFFSQTIEQEKIVGKKLTFLLQEMNREVNTISSKVNCVEISHLAVKMKEEIEKLREQVQNLE